MYDVQDITNQSYKKTMTTHLYKKEILETIHKFLPTVRIYLFGSRARKTQKEGSDIDLALDIGSSIELSTILTIKEALSETTIPVFIDIVDIHAIPDYLKQEILKEGIIWEN